MKSPNRRAAILKTPVRGDVATSFDASFRNNRVLSREGSNYIQANAQARRNDNNRNNEFRVYVHRDRGPQGHVDRNNIKVNWKGSSVGELDGKLSNVTVLYKKESILIIGTMQKNGYTLGVSLAIVKEAKLI